MKFIDQALIRVKAGDGGAGSSSFRREKYIAKGGPDGGNGGRGGHIIFRGNENLRTLFDFRLKREYFAQSGSYGRSQRRYGRQGNDLVLNVPVGTFVKHAETNEIIADIVTNGQKVVLAQGGKGGIGNYCFRSSVNQTPYEHQEGSLGEAFSLSLELKLLSDVGLIGCPNSGKSSLVSMMSSKQSKVGNYAFTTIRPVLGVMTGFAHDSCVIADLPGLLKGAHLGVGLGDQFLKHLERCQIFIFVIDISSQNNDPFNDYKMLCDELLHYNSSLKNVPRICVLNKIDLDYGDDSVKTFRESLNENVFLISAVTGEGCLPLKREIFRILNSLKQDSFS